MRGERYRRSVLEGLVAGSGVGAEPHHDAAGMNALNGTFIIGGGWSSSSSHFVEEVELFSLGQRLLVQESSSVT